METKELKTEEEKILMEQKMRETETIVARIMAESDSRTMEADRLKNELLKARLAEKDAKEKLLQFLSQPALDNVHPALLSSMNLIPPFTNLHQQTPPSQQHQQLHLQQPQVTLPLAITTPTNSSHHGSTISTFPAPSSSSLSSSSVPHLAPHQLLGNGGAGPPTKSSSSIQSNSASSSVSALSSIVSPEKQLQQLHQVQESLHSAIKDLISGSGAHLPPHNHPHQIHNNGYEDISSSSSSTAVGSAGGVSITQTLSFNSVPLLPMTGLSSNCGGGLSGSASNHHATDLLDPITWEIEKERIEYLEKSKNLQHQLKDLKSEIEKLKLEDKQSPYDIIHQEQVLSGENKYSTLRKIKSGSTKSRVAFFEEL